MDHRCGIRVPFVTDVLIRYLDTIAIPCQTRDLSHDGICIIDDGVDLPLHAVVEIELNIPGDTQEFHHVPAMLVYRDTGCYGFIFTQLNSMAQQAIDAYVNAHKTQS